MSNVDESDFDSALATQHVKKGLTSSLLLNYALHAIITAAVPICMFHHYYSFPLH